MLDAIYCRKEAQAGVRDGRAIEQRVLGCNIVGVVNMGSSAERRTVANRGGKIQESQRQVSRRACR